MKVDQLLFASVLFLCAVVAAIVIAPDAGVGGITHPEHSTMRHSGVGVPSEDATPETGSNLWLGWLFGVAVIVIFSALIAFGAQHRIRDFAPWLTLVTLTVIGAWSWLVYAYRGYLSDPAPELYLYLPAPTAIMTYLFWPLSGMFVLFFVLGFRHWVLSEEDFETYRRLLDSDRNQPEP